MLEGRALYKREQSKKGLENENRPEQWWLGKGRGIPLENQWKGGTWVTLEVNLTAFTDWPRSSCRDAM